MLKRLDLGLNKFYSVCGYLAALCLVTLALSVFTSILSRLFGVYIAGLTEIAGYLMAAANCLGLAYTLRSNGHIRINLFTSRLSPARRRLADIWALTAASVMMCYLAYFMIRLTYWSYILEEVSEGSDGWYLYYPQSVAAFGCCVMAIATVHSLAEKWFVSSEDAKSRPGNLKEVTNE